MHSNDGVINFDQSVQLRSTSSAGGSWDQNLKNKECLKNIEIIMYFHILCCWSWKMFGAGETQAVCISQTFIWYIKLIFLHLLQIFFSFLMITSTHCNRCVMSCLPDGCCQLTEASIRGGGCPQDVKGCKSIAWGSGAEQLAVVVVHRLWGVVSQ